MPPGIASVAASSGKHSPMRSVVLSRLRRLRLLAKARGEARIDPSTAIGEGVEIEVARGARLTVAAGCSLEPHVRIFVRAGQLELGRGALVRERASIVAVSGVRIGERVEVGERAAIVDVRPSFGDVERPLREQDVLAEGIEIGAGARIGVAAVIETGARVQAGAAIAAGASVGSSTAAGADPPPRGAEGLRPGRRP
jgi:acetyltransferase-like isoleucine patch superfamily enzyme